MMQDWMSECYRKAEEYMMQRDMQSLESVVRQWDCMLEKHQEEDSESLEYKVSKIRFLYLNGRLYVGEKMYEDATVYFKKSADLIREVFGIILERLDECPMTEDNKYENLMDCLGKGVAEDYALMGYDCILSLYGLWECYVQSQNVEQAVNLRMEITKKIHLLFPYFEENEILSTMAASRFVQISGMHSSYGDVQGALDSLAWALKVYEALYQKTRNNFHHVMIVRTKVMRLVFMMQISKIEMQAICELEKQLSLDKQANLGETSITCIVKEIGIMLGMIKGIHYMMNQNFSEAEQCFESVKNDFKETIPYFEQMHDSDNIFIRYNAKDILIRLKSYHIICMEQMGSCKSMRGDFQGSAECYEKVLELLGQEGFHMLRAEQMKLMAGCYLMLGMLKDELREFDSAEFYFERAVCSWKEISDETNAAEDVSAYKEALSRQKSFMKKYERKKRKAETKSSFFGRFFQKK